MLVKDLIRGLKECNLDMEIVVECPNGLLVAPMIKVIREKEFDYSSKVTKYVLDWQH